MGGLVERHTTRTREREKQETINNCFFICIFFSIFSILFFWSSICTTATPACSNTSSLWSGYMCGAAGGHSTLYCTADEAACGTETAAAATATTWDLLPKCGRPQGELGSSMSETAEEDGQVRGLGAAWRRCRRRVGSKSGCLRACLLK